jgi:hypothetical protein
MSSELTIGCSCGAFSGVARDVSARSVNRVVCYCDDCQLFAHFLGRADEVLDARGGTDILQMSPACLRIDAGSEKLACMRLTPKGIVRWYASCCRAPIGNTVAAAHVPFVGLIRACADRGEEVRSVDVKVGPVRSRIFGRFARGGRGEPGTKEGISLPSMLRFGGMILKWRFRGDHKRSPFFDPHSGQPTATPQVLSADELRDLRAARSRWLERPAA